MRDVFHIDLKQFPRIEEFMEKIEKLPNVKKYNDERPNVPLIPPQFAPI